MRKDDYRDQGHRRRRADRVPVQPRARALHGARDRRRTFSASRQRRGISRRTACAPGLHIGAVKEAIDLEARPNFVGDGINAAKRIMDFAAPGQITASRAYFEAVSWLDSAYAALFQHLGASDDKHGRAHELYAIAPSAAVLEKLRLDLAPARVERSPSADAKSALAEERTENAPRRRSATGLRERADAVVFVGAAVAIAVASSVLAAIYLANASARSGHVDGTSRGHRDGPIAAATESPARCRTDGAAPAPDVCAGILLRRLAPAPKSDAAASIRAPQAAEAPQPSARFRVRHRARAFEPVSCPAPTPGASRARPSSAPAAATTSGHAQRALPAHHRKGHTRRIVVARRKEGARELMSMTQGLPVSMRHAAVCLLGAARVGRLAQRRLRRRFPSVLRRRPSDLAVRRRRRLRGRRPADSGAAAARVQSAAEVGNRQGSVRSAEEGGAAAASRRHRRRPGDRRHHRPADVGVEIARLADCCNAPPRSSRSSTSSP